MSVPSIRTITCLILCSWFCLIVNANLREDAILKRNVRVASAASMSLRFLRGGADDNEAKSTLDKLVEDAIKSNRKIVVVTGGVLSGIGKGVTASSVGVLCRALGRRVTALKIDPYLNVDAGTMSPFEHGEVFVLDDGGECDLDLGNYERFLSVSLTSDSNLTTGKAYRVVIEKERVGEYLGKTVQVVPHISDSIQEHILRVAGTPVKSADNKYSNCKLNRVVIIASIQYYLFLTFYSAATGDLYCGTRWDNW